MRNTNSPVCRIYVDARSLQDIRFRERGIGQHGALLLTGIDATHLPGQKIELIACVDRSLPELKVEHAQLFSRIQGLSVPLERDSYFLQLSPMTHSPDPFQHALEDPSIRSVAIVYDFIPLDYPQLYLVGDRARQDYFASLAALYDYGKFISISVHTSENLQRRLGISSKDCFVSGVAVRESLIHSGRSAGEDEKFILVVGGGDTRKNVEVALRAHGQSRVLNGAGVGLKIVGHYSAASKDRIYALHADSGGDPSSLRIYENISDAELSGLYEAALVTVCPSRAEGFSIPVVEANANGCPVLVANCEAQTELMSVVDYQFDPDDDGRLQSLMESFVDPNNGSKALHRQGNFWEKFESQAVIERFWSALFGPEISTGPQGRDARPPFITRDTKPRLAILSPVPPDRSGVADYTAATMLAVAQHARLDLYTETNGRRWNRAFEEIHPLSPEPFRSPSYDGVISVLGNSDLHVGIFNLLLDYGGASIAHDARMLHFYVSVLGWDRAKAIASRELNRRIETEDINRWIADQRSLPTLFLSEILEASRPTFVHSPKTQEIIRDLYGQETIHLPFAVYRSRAREFDGEAGRERARKQIGLGDRERLVICLGDLVPDKGLEECVWTASILKQWGVDVRLSFVGNSNPVTKDYLRSIADSLGIGQNITFSEGAVDERTYQRYLAGADAAIQFRTYGLGGLSGAMLDGIAFGLPTVANEHLAASMESPSYVARVPDALSPVLAAERLMEIFEVQDRTWLEVERDEFLRTHSVDAYAKRLLNGMGLE